MSLTTQSIIDAWRIESSNWDQAIATKTARDYLVDLNKDRFDGHNWLAALAERQEEFPEFFELYNYDWCKDQSAFDFPIEASLQIRAIDAAIGLWQADIEDIPKCPTLSGIVARSTYLAKFKEVTPHVRKVKGGISFLISPLGWLEFIHRYFAGFATYLKIPNSQEDGVIQYCQGSWLNIAANLIASDVNRMDYFIPDMIKKIIEDVPAFNASHGDFEHTNETNLSQDLSYAAHDFSICHEIAHIVANDLDLPDEKRADRWGLAAYFGSWGRRPALHLDICRHDSLRASIGPFVFSSAVRALLGSRAAVLSRLDKSEKQRLTANYSKVGDRSRALWAETLKYKQLYAPKEMSAVYAEEVTRLESVLSHLLEYEIAFATFLKGLDNQSCEEAAKVAIAAEDDAIKFV